MADEKSSWAERLRGHPDTGEELTWLEWLRRKRTRDINLPRRQDVPPDPRLKGTSLKEAMSEAVKGLAILKEKGIF